MKKLYKLMALTLGTLTLATAGLSGCKKDDEKDAATTKTPEINSDYVYDGTHVYTATDTNDYLVKNGKTDYRLVIPAESSASLRVARTGCWLLVTGYWLLVVGYWLLAAGHWNTSDASAEVGGGGQRVARWK